MNSSHDESEILNFDLTPILRPKSTVVIGLSTRNPNHPGNAIFSKNLIEMETKTYPAAHTGTPMFSLEMTISVPADSSVKTLRDEFIIFCDDLNLDANLESKR